MLLTETIPFGTLLKQLRKRAGMTQRDLAAALNYSDSLISNLEKAQGKPDLQAVITRFVPALGLQDDPVSAARLIERAAAARGERLPGSLLVPVSFPRAPRVRIQEEADALPGHLPSPPTELIGRTEEINRLCNRLLGHSGRLLTLVGPPGIGKTQLALAIAVRLQHYFADGAVFVALAEIIDPVLMASAILTAVGSSDNRSKPPKTKLIESLRHKTMLLVLDNCEQIHDAAPLVAELLSSCAGIALLATSRERLHLRAEQRYHVPALELRPAVELFTQRAAAVDTRFELTEANRSTVEAICQRLDRLPLALELCAAQTDLLSLPQILAQLVDRRLDLLVDGAHDLPARQRTLRRAIQSSYTLLSEPERTLFRSLGVFVGGFDLGVVAMVGVSSQEAVVRGEPAGLHSTLHALIGKSLIRVETTSTGRQRFQLLETLREFALEQLRAHGEEVELRQRHYLAYLQLFRTGDSHLRGLEATTWITRLEPEQDNLRAALQWALDGERYADTAWLLIASADFWYLKGQRYEKEQWLARLLPHRQTLPVDLRLAILVDFATDDHYAVELIDLMEICPYKQLHAIAWFFLAFSIADPVQAGDVVARSVMLARAANEEPLLGAEFCCYTDNDFCLAATQWGYGVFLINRGEVAQASALITDSLHRFRKRGNQSFVADCLATLGLLALIRGDIAGAHTIYQEVVTIGTNHNLLEVLAESQSLLGIVTLYAGNVSKARSLLEECLRFCLDVKNTDYLSKVCLYLAELALWEGEPDQAAHWLGQSLAYGAARKRITMEELQRLFVTARLATMQGQYQRAATLFGVIEAEHRRIYYVYVGPMLALVNAARTTVHEALGAELFDEAFTIGLHLPLAEAYDTVLTPATIAELVMLPTPT